VPHLPQQAGASYQSPASALRMTGSASVYQNSADRPSPMGPRVSFKDLSPTHELQSPSTGEPVSEMQSSTRELLNAAGVDNGIL
jgi:hypothetical protein